MRNTKQEGDDIFIHDVRYTLLFENNSIVTSAMSFRLMMHEQTPCENPSLFLTFAVVPKMV